MDTTKQLIALHAQCSAMVMQLEALIDAEDSGECRHENAIDQSVMGQRPGERMFCQDCNQYFSKEV